MEERHVCDCEVIHQEVVETAALVHDKFQKLLTLVIDLLDR